MQTIVIQTNLSKGGGMPGGLRFESQRLELLEEGRRTASVGVEDVRGAGMYADCSIAETSYLSKEVSRIVICDRNLAL